MSRSAHARAAHRRSLLRAFAATITASVLALPVATAQPPAPTTTDVFSRLYWIEGGAQSVWRGIDRGDLGVGAGGALSWGDVGAGTTQVILLGDARTAATARSEASDLLRLGGLVVRQLSDEGNQFWLGADAFGLPGAAESALTAELSAGARVLLPAWLPENGTWLTVHGARDLARYDATWVRAALRQDAKFGVRNSVFVEIGQAWSSFPRGPLRGSTSFRRHGTDVTLTLVRQADPARTRTRGVTPSIEPFVRGFWITPNADPNLFDGGIRLVWVH